MVLGNNCQDYSDRVYLDLNPSFMRHSDFRSCSIFFDSLIKSPASIQVKEAGLLR